MNLGQIITSFRQQTKDLAKPYLTSDPEAIIYFNEAQCEAARRGRLFVDSTTDGVAQIPVSAGVPLVDVSSKVISIRRVRLQSSSRPLAKRLVREMDEVAPGWDTSTNTAQPTSIVVDYQTNAMFLYPTPNSDDTLLMTVTREPLADVEAYGDEPEIPARYLPACIEWMKYRAYDNADNDLHDDKKAAAALKRFEDEFGPAISATTERFEFEQYDNVGER